MATARSWAIQARLDALSVVSRAESVLSFQLATALQTSLDEVMSAGEQLAVLVLLCLSLEGMAMGQEHRGVRFTVTHSVLVVQVGQTLQGLLLYRTWAESGMHGLALGFLVNTLGLCLPSVLELVSPGFISSAYVQNALSVWLFQFAASTRIILARVDFGVSPTYICLLAFALGSFRTRSSTQHSTYKYVARAWHMMLVDWLLRTVAESTLGLRQMLQIALLAMLVVVVDLLGLERISLFREVRGFTIFRIASELQRLGVLSSDRVSALATALLAFCAHTGMGMLRLHSTVTSSAAEVFFVACTNVIVQSASSGGGAVQLARVGVVCIVAYAAQAALAGGTPRS
jgi:hypothetical protein